MPLRRISGFQHLSGTCRQMEGIKDLLKMHMFIFLERKKESHLETQQYTSKTEKVQIRNKLKCGINLAVDKE